MTLAPRIIDWMIETVKSEEHDGGMEVESVEILKGGTSSSMYSITLRSRQYIQEVVLRLVDNEEWLEEEPDLVLHEAKSLQYAKQAGLSSPQIIGYDLNGDTCGLPAVLMTKLPGQVVLEPPRLNVWLKRLADTQARIHQVDAADFGWEFSPYMNIREFDVPAWSQWQKQWHQAIEILKGTVPDYIPCFIHRDYHPANVLWKDDNVSGVVDWVNACRGPAGFDVGHCRSDLAKLYGVEAADQYLSFYQSAASTVSAASASAAGTRFHYDPYWDLLALVDTLFGPPDVYKGWTEFGVTGLTNELMIERIDAYFISLISRM